MTIKIIRYINNNACCDDEIAGGEGAGMAIFIIYLWPTGYAKFIYGQ